MRSLFFSLMVLLTVVTTINPVWANNKTCDSMLKPLPLPKIKLAREYTSREYIYGLGFVPRITTMREIANSDGELVLFRYISQAYQANYPASALQYDWGYSYSLSPYIAVNMAGHPINEQGVIVIARQNIFTDHLRFPNRRPPGSRGFSSQPLTPNTMVRDIIWYEEIKVHPDEERPWIVIPASDFKSIMKSKFADRPFMVEEVLNAMMNSPSARFLQ